MTNKILVLGSSNVDFILRIPRFHPLAFLT